MKKILLVSLLAAVAGSALTLGVLRLKPQKPAPALKIYVATLLIEDGGQMRLSSFIDLETSETAVRAHVAEFVVTRFAAGRLVSMEIGTVDEEMIALACAGRQSRRP